MNSTLQTDRAEHLTKVGSRLAWFGVAALLFALLVHAAAFWNRPWGEGDAWGAFGDYLGGVAGTIISLATLLAVVKTLQLQARELNETKALLERQTRLAKRQAFDSTFFKLLERFSDLETGGHAKFLQTVDGNYGATPEGNGEIAALESSYRAAYGPAEPTLGPYFRTLYQVVKLVEKNEDLDEHEQNDYVSFVRARLGSNELRMLFLNVVAYDEGREGLKPLVEKYGLLKHARRLDAPGIFNDFKDNRELLAASAFQSLYERKSALKSKVMS